MAVNLSFIGGAGWQFFTDNGVPLSGGKIYTYVAGTTTPLATYTSRSGLIPNTNPIILDAAGRTPEQIWSTEGILYKYVLKTSDDTLIRTYDNIGGSVVASDLAQDLANTTDNNKGDALIGFRQSDANGFLPGATPRTVNDKLQEIVSVKDFGAMCDGVTDDWDAIQTAQEYLKANGGGTLYFPGWCAIYKTFYFYGAVFGQWSNPYPVPTPPRITWASDGAGGIKSFITSGDVLRFSKPGNLLSYAPAFKDFAIDCTAKNVTAINGYAQSGVSGPNHYTDVNGLNIQGLTGVDAVGIDFGTITDSTISGLICQSYATSGRAGVIMNKTNVHLYGCRISYFDRGIEIGELAEAGVQMFGGHIIQSKTASVYWNNSALIADYKAAPTLFSGTFIGEQTLSGKVLAAANPLILDVATVTFEGCYFDNYRPGQPLIDIDWGGKFNFIGCSLWFASTGLNTIKFGQYCFVNMLNNYNIVVDPSSPALYFANVNSLPFQTNVAFTPKFVAAGSTFAYATDGQVGFYSKIGNLVTVTMRIFLATSGNTLTSDPLTITDLPFPVSSKPFDRSAIDVMWFVFNTSYIKMYGLTNEGTKTITLYALTSASTSSSANIVNANDMSATSGSGVNLTFSYMTNV